MFLTRSISRCIAADDAGVAPDDGVGGEAFGVDDGADADDDGAAGLAARFIPQLAQNFVPSARVVPHCGQTIFGGSSVGKR
jgi:hypothetical protein